RAVADDGHLQRRGVPQPARQLADRERLLDEVNGPKVASALLQTSRLETREHDHARAWARSENARDRLETIHLGHGHIEQHQVGLVLRRQPDGVVAGRPFAGYGEAAGDLEAAPNQLPEI